MEYELRWLIPRRVVLARVWGLQTVQAIVELSAALNEAFDQAEPPVHLLIDVGGIHLGEFGLDDYANAAQHLRHPKLGWWTTIGSDNPMFAFASKEVARRTGSQYQPTSSMAHALGFLRVVDRTLPRTVATDHSP